MNLQVIISSSSSPPFFRKQYHNNIIVINGCQVVAHCIEIFDAADLDFNLSSLSLLDLLLLLPRRHHPLVIICPINSSSFKYFMRLLLLIALRLLANGNGRLHPAKGRRTINSTHYTTSIPCVHLLLSDLIDFAADHIQVSVDRLLVRFVHLGQREQSHVR